MLFQKQLEKIYRTMVFGRCDDKGTAFYFSAEDFPGLNKVPYSFVSSKGDKLQGYFYYYDNPIKNRLVVFDHGFGGGHRSYMKEIEMLCKHGFLVFSYDHTGCMESEGESSNGLGQSLSDLNDCITALKKEEKLNGYSFSVMGHSWGGFSTLNIAALHPDITHIVVLSGFVSVDVMLSQFFPSFLRPLSKTFLAVEKKHNPESLKYNAVETLKNTKARVLLIYSDNDRAVKKEIHFDSLKKALESKDNVRLVLLSGKGHNPNYTSDAVKYLGEYTSTLAQKNKKKELQTAEQKKAFLDFFDWNRMTAQDEEVWAEIFKTLNI